jgi:hypothetical protein
MIHTFWNGVCALYSVVVSGTNSTWTFSIDGLLLEILTPFDDMTDIRLALFSQLRVV